MTCRAASKTALRSLQRLFFNSPSFTYRTSQLTSLSSFGSAAASHPSAPAVLLDGRAIATAWQEELAHEVAQIRSQGGRTPGLGVVLVGDRPDSLIYVTRKQEACELIGVRSVIRRLPASIPQEELRRAVANLCADPTLDGVLVQLPLPPHVDEEAMIEAFDPDKDVDGFHPLNVGRTLMRGRKAHFVPCTALGCVELLRRSGSTIQGSSVAIVGDSNIVGMPLAMLLRDEGASTVTVVHKTSYSGLFSAQRNNAVETASSSCSNISNSSSSRPPERSLESADHRAKAGACLPHTPGPRPYEVSYSSALREAYAHNLGPTCSQPGIAKANSLISTTTPGGFAAADEADLHELKRITRTADILIVAIGYPHVIKSDWIKPGAVVIDVGINVVDAPQEDVDVQDEGSCENKQESSKEGDGTTNTQWSPATDHPHLHVVGDVDVDDACKVASAVTPVPGGVGPMTIAALLHNTVRAAAARLGVELTETSKGGGGEGNVDYVENDRNEEVNSKSTI